MIANRLPSRTTASADEIVRAKLLREQYGGDIAAAAAALGVPVPTTGAPLDVVREQLKPGERVSGRTDQGIAMTLAGRVKNDGSTRQQRRAAARGAA